MQDRLKNLSNPVSYGFFPQRRIAGGRTLVIARQRGSQNCCTDAFNRLKPRVGTMFSAALAARFGRCFPLWIAGAVFLLGNSFADASCGDYLHSSHPVTDSRISHSMPLTHIPACPCRGPECHQIPDMPLSQLPVLLQSASFDRLLSPAEPLPPASSDRWNSRAGNTKFIAEDHRIGLDRPPRSRRILMALSLQNVPFA